MANLPIDRPDGVQIPKEIVAVKNWAMEPDIDSQERKRRIDVYQALRDDYLKLSGIEPEKEAVKQGVAADLVNLLKPLEEIPTTEAPESYLKGLLQGPKAAIGLDPAFTQYKTKLEALKIPVLRGFLGEKGATQAQEQQAAKDIFPPLPGFRGPGLMDKDIRKRTLDNAFDTVKATSGFDLEQHIRNTDPQMLRKIGAETGLFRTLVNLFGAARGK